MKTITMAAALAATGAVGATMVSAQNDRAGGAVSASSDRRSYDVGGFERIVAVGPHHFVVTVGGAASVRAEGDPESLEKYEVVVEDGALEIRPDKKYWHDDWDWREFQVKPATYYISLPRLEGTMLAGSGDMTVDRIDGDHFSASLAGSGALDIAALAVANAELAVAGSGTLRAAGSVREVQVSIAGSGDFDALKLASDTARISIAGSGDAKLTVDREANVSVVGSGNVEIAGNASCTISGFGSGQARCKDGVHDTRQQWNQWSGWDGARGREARDQARRWREWRREHDWHDED
jgi:hypothetical protein